MTRKRPAFAGTIQGPADLSQQKPWNPGSGATPFDEYLAASAEVDVPPTVCIRHGRHVPCRNDKYSCLLSSNGSMVAMVDAYQADPDAAWDFEHVVRSWIYMQKKGEGNW